MFGKLFEGWPQLLPILLGEESLKELKAIPQPPGLRVNVALLIDAVKSEKRKLTLVEFNEEDGDAAEGSVEDAPHSVVGIVWQEPRSPVKNLRIYEAELDGFEPMLENEHHNVSPASIADTYRGLFRGLPLVEPGRQLIPTAYSFFARENGLLVASFWFQRLGRVDRKSSLGGTRRYDGDFEIGCAMNFDFAVEWACGNLAQSAHHEKASAGRLTLAEMPQVDHRIGQRFECVVQLAEAIETKQQAAELIFPAEHTLDGVEPLFENGGVEKRFAASLESFSTAGICVDIGNHPAIENGFAVSPAIVDAIQADDGSVKVNANSMGDARHQRQGFSQERRFIAIARRRNKRRDDIAIAIAEGDDLVAFDLLVPAETDVVAAFLRRCRRTIAMDDSGVEKIGLMKRCHRTCKNGVKTAVRLPPSKRTVDARVMNFRTAFVIFFDRQFFPLTAQVKRL